LFFQITQAGFKIGQLGRRDPLTTCRATPRPVLGLLNVTLEALQLYPQLIQSSSSPRQVASCISLGFLELGYAVTHILQPCLHCLLALATLTLQRLGVGTHSSQILITHTARHQTKQE
jgi:hypothetical protein